MIDSEGNARLTIDKRAVSEEEKRQFTFAGEAIGIIKYSEAYRNDLYNECKKFLSNPQNISKNWEHVMNEFLLTHEMKIHQSVSETWVEIDNREDYERAQKLFGDKK